MLNLAGEMDIHLTVDRLSARIEAATELNRHSHFLRYHSSHDPFTTFEERVGCPRAGLQYKCGYAEIE